MKETRGEFHVLKSVTTGLKKESDLKSPCSASPRITERREVEQIGECGRCIISDCHHKRKLKETLTEAIEALEKTKAAFKSKQIEVLRKKLMKVLLEES